VSFTTPVITFGNFDLFHARPKGLRGRGPRFCRSKCFIFFVATPIAESFWPLLAVVGPAAIAPMEGQKWRCCLRRFSSRPVCAWAYCEACGYWGRGRGAGPGQTNIWHLKSKKKRCALRPALIGDWRVMAPCQCAMGHCKSPPQNLGPGPVLCALISWLQALGAFVVPITQFWRVSQSTPPHHHRRPPPPLPPALSCPLLSRRH